MIENFDMQKFEKNFAEIGRLKDKGKIKLDNPVQRGYVWNKKRDSDFIDSICRGMATSVFYYNKVGDSFELLEGKQRIEAVTEFMKNNYDLHAKLEPVIDEDGNLVQIAKKTFSELPSSLQNKIAQTIPLAQYGENMSIAQKKLFFIRINSGKPVTNAEISRIGILSRDVIFKLIEHPAIIAGVSLANKKKCLDEDIIKNIWAVFNLETPNLDNKKLGKILEERKITASEEEKITKSLDYLGELFLKIGGKNKKLVSKIQYKTHMVMVVYMAKLAIENEINVDDYALRVVSFFDTGSRTPSVSEEYNRASAAGVTKAENVSIRMREVEKALKA